MYDVEQAKKLIKEYYVREFGHDVKSQLASLFHDIRRVPLGYTTADTPGEEALQAYADLINRGIDFFVDGQLAKSKRYSPQGFLSELSNLDFDELMSEVDVEEFSMRDRKSVDELISDAKDRSKPGGDVGKVKDRVIE